MRNEKSLSFLLLLKNRKRKIMDNTLTIPIIRIFENDKLFKSIDTYSAGCLKLNVYTFNQLANVFTFICFEVF